MILFSEAPLEGEELTFQILKKKAKIEKARSCVLGQGLWSLVHIRPQEVHRIGYRGRNTQTASSFPLTRCPNPQRLKGKGCSPHMRLSGSRIKEEGRRKYVYRREFSMKSFYRRSEGTVVFLAGLVAAIKIGTQSRCPP